MQGWWHGLYLDLYNMHGLHVNVANMLKAVVAIVLDGIVGLGAAQHRGPH